MTLFRYSLFVLFAFCSLNAASYVVAPSSDSDGNFYVGWTDEAEDCSSNSLPAYRVNYGGSSYEITDAEKRSHYIQGLSQNSTHSVSIYRRRCSSSASSGEYMSYVGQASVSVSDDAIAFEQPFNFFVPLYAQPDPYFEITWDPLVNPTQTPGSYVEVFYEKLIETGAPYNRTWETTTNNVSSSINHGSYRKYGANDDYKYTYNYCRTLSQYSGLCEPGTNASGTVRMVNLDSLSNTYEANAVGSTPYTVDVDSKGNANISVPIKVKPGRNKMEPAVSIVYNSGGAASVSNIHEGQSLFKGGWGLSGFSEIHRCRKGERSQSVVMTNWPYVYPLARPRIQWNDEDSICLDEQKLVLVSGSHWRVGAEYHTEVESFKRIKIKALPGYSNAQANAGAHFWFEVRQPDGRIADYGKTTNARRTMYAGYPYLAWAISEVRDTYDNSMTYEYSNQPAPFNKDPYLENDQDNYDKRDEEALLRFTPKHIAYPSGKVEFDLTSPRKITVSANGGENRVYYLGGRNGGNPGEITTIQECFNGTESCLPPIKFVHKDVDHSIVDGYDEHVWKIVDGIGKTTIIDYTGIEKECQLTSRYDRAGNVFSEWPLLHAISDIFVENAEMYGGGFEKKFPDKWEDIFLLEKTGLFCRDRRGMPDIGDLGSAVSRLEIQDNQGQKSSWSYRYGDPGFNNADGHGFAGFSLIRKTNDQTNVTTYTQYRLIQKLNGLVQAETVYSEPTNRGFEEEETTEILSTVVNHHDVILITHPNGQRTYYPYLKEAHSREYENGAMVSATQVGTSIEMNGRFPESRTTETIVSATGYVDTNQIVENPWGDKYNHWIPMDASVVSKSTETVEYENRAYSSDWRIMFVKKKQDSIQNGSDSKTNLDSKNRETNFFANGYTFDVQRQIDFPGDPNLELTTITERDDQGNVRTVNQEGANIKGRQTVFNGYENTTIPSEIINAKGHKVSHLEFDPNYDLPTYSIDANGGTTQARYDGFERLVEAVDTEGNTTRVEYKNCEQPSGRICDWPEGAYQKIVTTDAAPTQKSEHDALDRVIATYTQGLTAGEWIKTHIIYNESGQVAQQSTPYTESASRRYISYQYDNKGRKTLESRPDGSSVEWIYDYATLNSIRYRRVITVERVLTHTGNYHKSLVKVAYYNALGQLVMSEDGAYTTGTYTNLSNLTNSQRVTTTYEYDAYGNPTKVAVDGGSNGGTTTTTSKFDNAGNRIELDGPNVGKVESGYTALGQTLWTLDAEENLINYEYDELGRVTQKSSPTDVAIYTYDLSLKGALYKQQNSSGYEATYSYSNRKLYYLGEKLRAGGKSFNRSSRYYYDTHGRLESQKFVTGFTVRNEYSETGYLSAIYDASNDETPLQEITDVGAFGVKSLTYGNGVKTVKDYDINTGFLTEIDHQTPTGNAMNYQKYQWYTNGNLYQRGYSESSRTGDTYKEQFTYDAHNRLTKARTYVSNVLRRTKDTSYDNLGNIKSNTSSVTGDIDVTGYIYGTQESCTNKAGPHAVSKVTIKGVQNTLCYNKSGYITRYTRSGSDKFIKYNTQGQPTLITVGDSISDTTPDAKDEFKYGPSGQRFYKRSEYKKGSQTQVEEVFYYADGTEHTYYTGNYSHTQTFKTPVGSGVMINKRYNYLGWDNSIQYLHKDHIGSVVAITDEDFSGQLEKLAYDGFGARRTSDWTKDLSESATQAMLENSGENTNRGFTGHEHLDHTGFIHMNGRVYDPVLARFLTPDPLVSAPTFSQSWNRYSYVLNNPLKYTDPSGYSPTTEYEQEVARNGKKLEKDVVDDGIVGSTETTEGGGDTEVVQNKGSERSEQIIEGKKDGSQRCISGCTDDGPSDSDKRKLRQNKIRAKMMNGSLWQGGRGQESNSRPKRGLGYYLPTAPQGVVDFSAGLGDALLLSFGDDLREAFDIYGGVDEDAMAYKSGAWASFAAGGGRLIYAGIAKGYSIAASSGAAASAFRQQLKNMFRFGAGKNWRKPDLTKYPTDAALRAAAGRTNLEMNLYGASVAGSGAYGGYR